MYNIAWLVFISLLVKQFLTKCKPTLNEEK